MYTRSERYKPKPIQQIVLLLKYRDHVFNLKKISHTIFSFTIQKLRIGIQNWFHLTKIPSLQKKTRSQIPSYILSHISNLIARTSPFSNPQTLQAFKELQRNIWKINIPDMQGVRTPSPITMEVPSIVANNRKNLANWLFSSLALTTDAIR